MTKKFISIDNASALTPEALSSLKDLDQSFFPTPWSSESWDKVFYTLGEKYILISEGDGSVMGFTLFDINGADSFAHLLKILVNPNVRGLGIGKALLNKALDELKLRGIKDFFLEVEEHNNPAINLYESVGFKIIHQKKQFYSNGATALIMTMSA